MLFHSRSRDKVKSGVNKLFIDQNCFEQTLIVVEGKAKAAGIQVVIGDIETSNLDGTYFAALVQFPDKEGFAKDFNQVVAQLTLNDIKLIVASDLLALTLMTPSRRMGCGRCSWKLTAIRSPNGIRRTARGVLRNERRV